jgi:hypothetical protein
MDGKSFAQTFIKNYSIPELTSFRDRSDDYAGAWYYTSNKGFKVIITENKDLIRNFL